MTNLPSRVLAKNQIWLELIQLAAELLTNPRYASKTVLVCWHHGKIPRLAKALGSLR